MVGLAHFRVRFDSMAFFSSNSVPGIEIPRFTRTEVDFIPFFLPPTFNMGSLSDSPSGQLFTIEDAPGAGRGVFATRDLSAGETVHIADDLSVHVLFREYRGEICYNCFAYDLGGKQPIKDAIHGIAFCSKQCQLKFTLQCDELCMAARAVVEKLIRMKATSNQHSDTLLGVRPTPKEIGIAWNTAETQAPLIRSARLSVIPGPDTLPATKPQLRALQRALSTPVCPDVLTFLLTVVLANYNTHKTSPFPSPISSPAQQPLQDSPPLLSLLSPSLSGLESEPTPYLSPHELSEYTTSYLHLVSILPLPLLPFISPSLLHTTKSRETHNSFGIRSLEDEGSEFFGYGVWPSASYFNHSCEPNLVRGREGRGWVFRTGNRVEKGEQLYISYVNGGSGELTSGSGGVIGREERRGLLRRTWGFECACGKCRGEEGGGV